MQTTAELTVQYINEHPFIKHSLRKGLVNYSALARLIAKESKITKKTSMEAILVAARRYEQKIQKDITQEKQVAKVISNSQIEVKNKIEVVISSKDTDLKNIQKIQQKGKNESLTFLILEASNHYIFIMHSSLVQELSEYVTIIENTKNLSLIYIRNRKEIEQTPGVISYLTSLFAQNGINIVEFFSCWTDTWVVIETTDVAKTFEFLNF